MSLTIEKFANCIDDPSITDEALQEVKKQTTRSYINFKGTDRESMSILDKYCAALSNYEKKQLSKDVVVL